MSHAKQASLKQKRSIYAVPALSAAVGLSLSLASGASAAIPGTDTPTPKTGTSHEITLCEEEISDVSLATFYAFDDNARTFRRSLRLAAGGGCGCGCGGKKRWPSWSGDEGCYSCSTSTNSVAWPAGRYGNPPRYSTKTPRKYTNTTKRRRIPK
jgi:hypothetical protein